MSYDIFLKIDGIDGESMDDKHKNEIEVLSWRWNIHQESTMHAGSGLGSGKVSVTNLSFEHYIDRASPNLFKYCSSGKHIPQAILVMRKAGGNPLEYLKYTFTDLIIAMVSPSGSQGGEIASRESIELSFSTVKQEYVVQNQQGGSGGTITAGYDFKANKEIYPYDVPDYASSSSGLVPRGSHMKICITVGHSILKSGACTSADGVVNEYQYNKSLAPVLADTFRKEGHKVDVIICPEKQFKTKNEEKSYKIPRVNSGGYDLLIELHLNASNGQGKGSEVLYYSNKGLEYATRICDKLGTVFKNRGAKLDKRLYILNSSKPTAVLIESFFCDNKEDYDKAKKLGHEGIAKLIVEGVLNKNIN